MEKASEKWTDEAVQALLALYSTEVVQRKFQGEQRNTKIFEKISDELQKVGMFHTTKQCREKIKKLKQDYKKIKDYNSKGGTNTKTSKWYQMLDQILGHRAAYSGNAATKDAASALLEAVVQGDNSVSPSEAEVTTPEPSSASTSPAASVPCSPKPGSAPEPTASASTSLPSTAASAPPRSRPRKRSHADGLQATIEAMLESDADRQKRSDERFDSLFLSFREQAQREAEEREALRAEVAEGKHLQTNVMEVLLGILNRMAASSDNHSLQSARKNLWPGCVPARDFEGFPEQAVPVITETVNMATALSLEVKKEDVEELVEDHKFTTEELVELQREQLNVVQEEQSGEAWNNVSYHTLPSVWKEHWPGCVSNGGINGSQEETAPVLNDTGNMTTTLSLEVKEEDVEEQKLTTEELHELKDEQLTVVQVEHVGEQEDVRDVSSADIKAICSKWSDLQAFIEKYHPDKTVASRAVNHLNDNVMSHFRKILQQKKKTNVSR